MRLVAILLNIFGAFFAAVTWAYLLSWTKKYLENKHKISIMVSIAEGSKGEGL